MDIDKVASVLGQVAPETAEALGRMFGEAPPKEAPEGGGTAPTPTVSAVVGRELWGAPGGLSVLSGGPAWQVIDTPKTFKADFQIRNQGSLAYKGIYLTKEAGWKWVVVLDETGQNVLVRYKLKEGEKP